MIFVSERDSLETLHIALRFNDNTEPKVRVFSMAEVFDTSTFGGVRMEDSGCIAGDYLIYVSTKEPAEQRRQPWTAIYRTNLKTGETDRLMPKGQADLSPAVSPSGKKIAVASFKGKDGNWNGEIEDRKTNIFGMGVDEPFKRKMVVRNGGWPTWGSDDIIFFHRKQPSTPPQWRSQLFTRDQISKMSTLKKTNIGGSKHIGYHRCKSKLKVPTSGDDVQRKFYELESLDRSVGLFRVSGVFPTFSIKTAPNLHSSTTSSRPFWNQNPAIDILYVCVGPSFSPDKELAISAIPVISKGEYGDGDGITRLTEGHWTDTHCQWSPNSDWIVFSSTHDKPIEAPTKDKELDRGYFEIYLVTANDPSVAVRVTGSGNDLAGHVNHPFFCPDEKSIVVTADLAAVSADPISLPLFLHSVNIFTVDIDPTDIKKNKDVKEFKRITHSRYERANNWQ
ncbi:hypothetical protein TIFTF001_033617 [Ficus carica]|uniref:Uncharacterized protein n=1 Tax=Ficus carica TaxID=3494 RepID=A0AA88E2D9_FICCA|nr:hypothetical protein TIFTF001_033617 [Ficus carica]